MAGLFSFVEDVAGRTHAAELSDRGELDPCRNETFAIMKLQDRNRDSSLVFFRSFKNEIEDLRKENALQGLVDKNNAPLNHPKEESLQNELERAKLVYRNGVIEVKDLKSEIERIQVLLKNMRDKLQADFESWLEIMLKQSRPAIRDPSVNDNLQAFYKARDEIYRNMPG